MLTLEQLCKIIYLPTIYDLLDDQKNKRVPEKHLLLFIDYAKDIDYVDHKKMWKILKEVGIPDHLTYLLRNL